MRPSTKPRIDIRPGLPRDHLAQPAGGGFAHMSPLRPAAAPFRRRPWTIDGCGRSRLLRPRWPQPSAIGPRAQSTVSWRAGKGPIVWDRGSARAPDPFRGIRCPRCPLQAAGQTNRRLGGPTLKAPQCPISLQGRCSTAAQPQYCPQAQILAPESRRPLQSQVVVSRAARRGNGGRDPARTIVHRGVSI